MPCGARPSSGRPRSCPAHRFLVNQSISCCSGTTPVCFPTSFWKKMSVGPAQVKPVQRWFFSKNLGCKETHCVIFASRSDVQSVAQRDATLLSSIQFAKMTQCVSLQPNFLEKNARRSNLSEIGSTSIFFQKLVGKQTGVVPEQQLIEMTD